MEPVWENDTEILRHLDDLERRVEQAQKDDLQQRELKEEAAACNEMLKAVRELLQKQRVDIAYVSKKNGVVDKVQQADLTANYITPSQQKHNALKADIAALAQGKPIPSRNTMPQPLRRPVSPTTPAQEDLQAYVMSPTETDPQSGRTFNGGHSGAPPAQPSARSRLFGGGGSSGSVIDEGGVEVEMESERQQVAKVQDTAINVQKDGIAALHRAEAMTAHTAEVANDITTQLRAQEEELELIDMEMNDLKSQIKIARRQVGQFSRRLATDKCFVCLFILVLLFICVVVGLKIFNKSDDSTTDEDEELQFEDSPEAQSIVFSVRRLL
eukprot:TRINITY_DN20774_c0_g1_i1.p1 TRINITY_DN20774_c0_g1~~TRINITY_DN20774_c0_g1_i1.p1  ORF type:complete len:327 (+),score=102.15 TRINITY_DN20774_c0_g1_i1:381-1361(+)